MSPWLDVELEETEALMGADFHQDGFERNRATIEAFCQQAFDLGITKRTEWFAIEYTGRFWISQAGDRKSVV